MRDLAAIVRFGWPYFQKYQSRLAIGIFLGVLFGFSNASFIWATKTLINRMSPEGAATEMHDATAASTQVTNVVSGASFATNTADASAPNAVVDSSTAQASSTEKKMGTLERWKMEMEKRSNEVMDPWLPARGRSIDWKQIFGGLFFLPVLVAFRGIMGYLSSYYMAWVSERVVSDLRVDVLQKLSTLSLDYFNRSTMGDLLTHVNTDTASLQRCLSIGFSDLVKEPITIIGIFITLCFIDWQLTLGAMTFFPVCVLPIVILGRKVRRASKAGWDINIIQSSMLVEMLSGIRVIKAFGLESQQVKRFRQLSQDLVSHGMKSVRAKEKINPIIETVAMMGFGALIVYISYRNRSIDDMVSFLTGMVLFYTPVKKLAGLHVLFEQTRAGVDRLVNIFREQPTVKEPAKPQPLKSFNDAITFDDVSFAYGNEVVLKNLSLRIPKGTKLGIAGESGSGKSTLVNLIFRFYDPTHGAIRIDGKDIREVASDDVHHLMALVSQEIVIFDQSAADNIRCGKPDATDAEVEAAARAAYAHEFIQNLPNGYKTRVGERGVTLSGGQRQRIAIARAFIRNAPILVLDEATASLDSQSEAEVQSAIDLLAQNRTVISVAHRLSTLASMDRIIVLSKGKLVEEGTFTQLLQRNQIFAGMAKRQGILLAP